MPHGGYHGNIVGLGQSGTTGGPAGMGGPPPKPKKSTQNVKSLMTSDDAYSTGTDTNKKKSTTALTFDDDTPREKGLQSNISSKELGRKRKEKVLDIILTSGNEDEINRKIKEENLEGAVTSLMKKVPEKSFDTKTDSVTRAAMKKMGVPLQYSTFFYDAFIGTKTPFVNPFLSTDEYKTRRTTYKPLTINDFSNTQLLSLKQQAINAMKDHASRYGSLNTNQQIMFRVGGTVDLNNTLGTVSTFIDENNNIRILDTYDFGAATVSYGIPVQTYNGDFKLVKPTNYGEMISAVMVNQVQNAMSNQFSTRTLFDNIRTAVATMEASGDYNYPKTNVEKKQFEEETGQKVMMDLNLGEVN